MLSITAPVIPDPPGTRLGVLTHTHSLDQTSLCFHWTPPTPALENWAKLSTVDPHRVKVNRHFEDRKGSMNWAGLAGHWSTSECYGRRRSGAPLCMAPSWGNACLVSHLLLITGFHLTIRTEHHSWADRCPNKSRYGRAHCLRQSTLAPASPKANTDRAYSLLIVQTCFLSTPRPRRRSLPEVVKSREALRDNMTAGPSLLGFWWSWDNEVMLVQATVPRSKVLCKRRTWRKQEGLAPGRLGCSPGPRSVLPLRCTLWEGEGGPVFLLHVGYSAGHPTPAHSVGRVQARRSKQLPSEVLVASVAGRELVYFCTDLGSDPAPRTPCPAAPRRRWICLSSLPRGSVSWGLIRGPRG